MVKNLFTHLFLLQLILSNGSKNLINDAFQVGCGLMIAGLSLTLGTFLCWHIYLTAHNMTTVEVRSVALHLVEFIHVKIDF